MVGSDITIVQGEVTAPGGMGPARADFTQGVGGQVKLAFRQMPLDSFGFVGGAGVLSGGMFGTGGHRYQRQGPLASQITHEMLVGDPVLASIVLSKVTAALGQGLQFSSKPDWRALGLTEEQGRDLAQQIDRGFKAWAADPLEVDYTGRSTLHDLASQAFTSYLLAGEVVATIEWMACRDALTRTKIRVCDARQMDYTKNTESEEGGCAFGVQFDTRGRVSGYWLRPMVYGALVNMPMPKFFKAYTTWKRPRVLHIFDARLPGQVRGVSPLIASLSPAAERAMLSQFTLEKAVVEAAFAATLESDLPQDMKHGGINAGGAVFTGVTAQFATDPIGSRQPWYEENKLELRAGQVNALSPGEKLHLHTAGTPGNGFEPFNNALTRQAAKAAGESYESVSGDFTKSSFAASRLALELPYRAMLVERAKILIKFYQSALNVWIEEAIYAGKVKVPRRAEPFWANPTAYTSGKWLGMGRISPDPKKQIEADAMEIANGLSTRTDKLAERGLDFDETVALLKYERETMIAAGLNPDVEGNVTTQFRQVKEEIQED